MLFSAVLSQPVSDDGMMDGGKKRIDTFVFRSTCLKRSDWAEVGVFHFWSLELVVM